MSNFIIMASKATLLNHEVLYERIQTLKRIILVSKLLNYIKNAVLLISFVWLLIFMRHLQIRPEYNRKQQISQNSPDDYSPTDLISVYTQMKLVKKILTFDTLLNGQTNPRGQFIFLHINQCQQTEAPCLNLNYFSLLKHYPPGSLQCYSVLKDQELTILTTNVLIIHASHRNPSIQAVMGMVRALHQRAIIQCPYPLQTFLLSKNQHLLMNNDLQIMKLVNEIRSVIEALKGFRNKRLSIIAYQQSSILLLKTIKLLQPKLIERIDKIVMINLMSADIRINMEQSWSYIKQIQQNLLQISNKKQIQIIMKLNKTQILFMNTWKYQNKPYHSSKSQYFYRFLFESSTQEPSIFYNTAFIQSRYIQNIYNLIEPQKYFTITSFTNKIALFVLRRSLQSISDFKQPSMSFQRQTQLLFYHDFFGHTFLPKQEQDNLGVCHQVKPIISRQQKQSGKIKTIILDNSKKLTFNTKCVKVYIEHIQKFIQYRGLGLMFIGTQKMQVYNHRMEILPKYLSLKNQSNYLIETFLGASTKYFIINNKQRSRCIIQLINIYNPITNSIINPISPTTNSKPQINLLAQPQITSLVTICPHHQKLLFPRHFNRRSVQKYLLSGQYIKLSHTQRQVYNCYIDINLYDIVPDVVLRYWTIEVNIVIFTLVCSYINKSKVQNRYWLQLLSNWVLTFITLLKYQDQQSNYLYIVNFIILAFVIMVEKLMQILIVLTRLLQQMVSQNYQKIMLLIIIVTSGLKYVFPHELQQISAYKILLLAFFFLVNPFNIMLILIKFYLNADLIIHNHNKFGNVLILCLWIYTSFLYKKQFQRSRKNQNSQNTGDIIANNMLKIPKTVGFAQYILVGGLTIFIDGSQQYTQLFINSYIIIKTSKMFLNM